VRGGLAAAALAAGIGAAAGSLAAADAPAPRYDIVYSTEVATPHVPWATRLPGGPISSFFIPPVAAGRDMVELMQRLALTPTTVTIDRQWDVNCWGIGDYYGHEFRGDRDDFRTVYGYVEQELTSAKRFEVLLIPGLNGWSRLTRASRDAILRRVRDGAGLVLLHPFVGDVRGHPFLGDEAEGDPRIWDVSPLVGAPDDFVSERGYPEPNSAAISKARWERATPHFITEGLPLELIPSGLSGGRLYDYKARGDVLIQAGGRPVMATGAYGRGRVVALAYVDEGFLPESIDPIQARIYWDYWEYEYALLVRSLLWASRRESGVALEAPRFTGEAPSRLELSLRSDQPREVEIAVTGRSEFGPRLVPHSERETLPAGASKVTLPVERIRPAEGWSGGRQIADVIVSDPATGATLDFGTAVFSAPKRATIASLKPNAAVYRDGDTVSVVTRAAGDLRGLKMRLEMRDDLGRLLHAEERATPGERTFFARLDDFVGKRALLTASLLDGGRIVDQLRAEAVSVVQKERRGREYRGLLSFEEPRHFLAPLRQRRLRELAMDGGFTWGGAVNDSLEMPRGWFGVYWYDRGPTTPEGLEAAIQEYERTGDFDALQYLTKKELYRRTGDKRYLVRSPSLDDPQVLRTLADLARTAARNKAPYNMDYYFVGDEGSLTSYTDPVDFDFGSYALACFRKWLSTQYASLAALNRAWRTKYRDWDSVVPDTTEEARKTGTFPPWADHRTYMETSFARAYQVARDAVREGDPEGRIAISGTQVTTPWDGADWYRLDHVVDDFLSYDGGNQWDLHRSFAKAGARVGFWTGYGRRGVAVQHEIWSAALQGVFFPNLFWSYSVVNPDLTWSRSGRDMGAAFQALRFEGVGRLLMESERLGDGIAVHYSMASVHAAGILGFHEARREETAIPSLFPADRDGWVKGLTDLGLSFDFIASPQIEGGALDPRRFRVFAMPFSLALSAPEARAIEAFARGGGIVIADGAPGLLDEHCAWAGAGLLDALFGVEAPPSETRALTARLPAGPVSVTDEGKAWGLSAPDLEGLGAFEAGLHVAGSTALVRAGNVDAVFARPVGRGWAIYLNVLFDAYPRLRKEEHGGSGLRSLLATLLAHGGVRPAVGVTDAGGAPWRPVRVARYRFGDAEIVGILPEPLDVETSHGVDGVAVYEKSQEGREARRVEVSLPTEGDIVDVRSGKFLGHTRRVQASLEPGGALVLAVSRARGTVAMDGPTTAERGQHPRFVVSGSGSGKRLFRCHVAGPGGRDMSLYARNVVAEGAPATFVLPSALDDPAGTYRIDCTDVVAGASAGISLELR
jgi:Beta-galactosidase